MNLSSRQRRDISIEIRILRSRTPAYSHIAPLEQGDLFRDEPFFRQRRDISIEIRILRSRTPAECYVFLEQGGLFRDEPFFTPAA